MKMVGREGKKEGRGGAVFFFPAVFPSPFGACFMVGGCGDVCWLRGNRESAPAPDSAWGGGERTRGGACYPSALII